MLKRIRLTSVLMIFVASGAIHGPLVADETAQKPEQSAPTSASEALRGRIDIFLAGLQVGDDEVLTQLKEVLGTEAGLIVLNDRSARRASTVREKTQANAVTDYLKRHFEASGEGYALIEGQEEYRQSFLTAAKQINDEIDVVAAVLKEATSRVDAESDAAKLLLRFMESEGAAPMFYFTVRPYLRPGGALIERELGKVFVPDENGRYTVRPGRRSDAELFVTRTQLQLALVGPLQKELSAWAADVAPVDDLHQQMLTAFADPLFAVHMAIKLYQSEGAQQPASNQVNKFFDGMEKALRDTAEGLAIRDEARGGIEKMLAEFTLVRQSTDGVRLMLTQYASRIQADDDLHRQWVELLRSDIAVVMFGRSYETGAVTPEAAMKATLATLFNDEGGRLKLISGKEQQAEAYAAKMLRDYREARRRGQSFTDFAEKITDREFGEVFASTGGKFVMTTDAQSAVSELNIEGFTLWRDEFFEAKDAGYVAKDTAADEVRSILADVAKIGEELKKDDF